MIATPEPPVVAFGGDVILGQRQNALTARDGPAQALAGVPELAAADLAVVNLEGVVANAGAPVAKPGPPPFYFRGRPELLAVLAAAGVDLVGTANNHSGDYGPAALLEQARLLDGMGLGHAGSGPSRAAACAPVLRHAGALTVALFAADATMPPFAATEQTPGTCYLPWNDPAAWRTSFAPRIAAARRSAHVVLVMVHSGPDFAPTPMPHDIAIAHALIEAGADAILGTSTHLLQGVEIYRGRPIVYDAGNLLWNSPKRPGESAVFSLVLEPGGVRQICVAPVEAGYGTSRTVSGERGRAILTALRDRSAVLGTTVAIDGERGVIDLPPPPPRDSPPEAAPPDPPRGPPPAPALAPPPGCVVSAVSDEARIAALAIGPLALLGVAVEPSRLTERTTLWLETYWTATAAVGDDLWIAAAGRPLRPDAQPWEGDHEPCDWLWPTSRWTPGTIYRDRYGLRPPRFPVTAELDVSVGLRRWGEPIGTDQTVARVAVAAQERPRPERGHRRRNQRGG